MPGKTRRPKGDGSLFRVKTKTGALKWQAMTSWTEGGKRRRKKITRDKQADVLAELDAVKRDHAAGIVAPHAMTITSLLDEWFKVAKREKAENTVALWNTEIETHLKPACEASSVPQKLTAFKRPQLELFLTEMSEIPGIGDRTRELCYEILSMALGYAVESSYIAKNPCFKVARPKYEREPIDPFEVNETRVILDETIGTRYHVAHQLAFCDGMRQGEIFGLKWTKVNLKKLTIRIDEQVQEISGILYHGRPKTKASIRTISIPWHVGEALKAQKMILRAEGNGDSELVCPARQGGYTRKGNFNKRVWQPLLTSLGFRSRGYHHARHTFAATAIGENKSIIVVSKMLGHAKPSITLDIYGHLMKTHQDEVIQLFDCLYGKASGYPKATFTAVQSS